MELNRMAAAKTSLVNAFIWNSYLGCSVCGFGLLLSASPLSSALVESPLANNAASIFATRRPKNHITHCQEGMAGDRLGSGSAWRVRRQTASNVLSIYRR